MLEFSTPPLAIKKNVNNKAIYTSLPRIGTREANASTKVTNTLGIRKDLILIGTFQDYMHEIVGEDTSHDKDSYASIRIIKPSPIVGRKAFGKTRI